MQCSLCSCAILQATEFKSDDSNGNPLENNSEESPLMIRKKEKVCGAMTDDDVDAALRKACKCSDPFKRYSRIKEAGAGYYYFLYVLPLDSEVFYLCRASGTVYIALDLQSNQRVAIKEIDLSKQPKREMILNEIFVMKDITHPNLVNFLDAYYNGEFLWVRYVMLIARQSYEKNVTSRW